MSAQPEVVHELTTTNPPRQEAPRAQAIVTTPGDLLAMAVGNGADIQTLERLMALKERHEANEARKGYVDAMARFKAEPIDIRKTKAVGYETQAGDFVGYKHATVADVVDAVVPAMARHGLSHAWEVHQESGQVRVTCTITHALGHRESVTMTAAPDDSGKKNKIQQVASTVTYLQRYTLMAATGVAAKDMDSDGREPPGEPEGDDDSERVITDWVSAIDECATRTELAERRKEMIAKLGGGDVNKVPQKVRDAAVRKAEQFARPQA